MRNLFDLALQKNVRQLRAARLLDASLVDGVQLLRQAGAPE
jgi:hypothetical protein